MALRYGSFLLPLALAAVVAVAQERTSRFDLEDCHVSVVTRGERNITLAGFLDAREEDVSRTMFDIRIISNTGAPDIRFILEGNELRKYMEDRKMGPQNARNYGRILRDYAAEHKITTVTYDKPKPDMLKGKEE